MTTVGIRDLKNSLSKYVRRAEAGERIVVTDHGRAVAVLTPAPALEPELWPGYNAMVAAGVVTPAKDHRPTFHGIRTLRLPPGTAKWLIDEGRAED